MDEKKIIGEHFCDFRPKQPNLVLAKIGTNKVVPVHVLSFCSIGKEIGI